MLKVTASVFCVSGPLVFDAATRGCPLMAQLWCWGGLYFWVLQECGNWRDSSWQATTIPTQGTTHSGLGHIIQSFCEGELFACPGASA